MQTTHEASEIAPYLPFNSRFTIQLDFGPNDSLSGSTTFLGLKEGAYLIFDLSTALRDSLSLRNTKNIDVIVRGVVDSDYGHIIAFKTRTLHLLSSPVSLMLLRLPTRFVTKPIRAHERFKLHLKAVLQHSGHRYEGLLTDFSISGCGFQTLVEPEFVTGDLIELNCPLSPQLGQDMNGKIASTRKVNHGWLIGIQFSNPVEMTNTLRHELIEHHYESLRLVK